MDHCGTETLQPTIQFKIADQLTKLPFGVAQHCSVLVLALQNFFYAENVVVILVYEMKLLFTSLLLCENKFEQSTNHLG